MRGPGSAGRNLEGRGWRPAGNSWQWSSAPSPKSCGLCGDQYPSTPVGGGGQVRELLARVLQSLGSWTEQRASPPPGGDASHKSQGQPKPQPRSKPQGVAEMQHPNSNRLYGTANFREVAKQDREAVPCPISAAEGLKILRDSRPLGTGGRRGRASRPAGNTRRRGSRRIATAARGAPPTDGDHPNRAATWRPRAWRAHPRIQRYAKQTRRAARLAGKLHRRRWRGVYSE